MMVTFVSECEKKALNRTRRVLDAFANRIGSRTWQTVITQQGLQAVKKLLRKTASKSTAVSCHLVRSRSRSELLWVVGNRQKFNRQGIVPVNTTRKTILNTQWENDWHYLPLIKALTAMAALFHDWGKASEFFQTKLKQHKIIADPLRHEWISILFLNAYVGDDSDQQWLSRLATGEINEKEITAKAQLRVSAPLARLPDTASLLAWLVVTHHRLPVKKEYKGEPADDFKLLFNVINEDWGYSNRRDPAEFKLNVERCFNYPNRLPGYSEPWMKQAKKWSKKLHDCLHLVEQSLEDGSWRAILHHARLSLMLGDHYYSSCEADQSWQSDLQLYANTDSKTGNLKQKLDEHLVGVASSALKIAHLLPAFEGNETQLPRVHDVRALKKKSPAKFHWQDIAVSKITEWRQSVDIAKTQANFGFFAVNMASTGKGKTFANAKIMRALSIDCESLRYILALGLRTLTLQTGDEYRGRIGLDETELAVLIGSRAVSDLHRRNKEKHSAKSQTIEDTGSESLESLIDNEIDFDSEIPEGVLSTVFTNDAAGDKNRKFLYAPVLACTIDHIMAATETTRGGRYILPCLRLMSSDLVIDEIDDFDGKDLVAIGRLIHLAGMLGRKVMISSATIPPDLAEGYFNAYQSGWSVFSNSRDASNKITCAWIDEFTTQVKAITTHENTKKIIAFAENHQQFVAKRVKTLNREKPRRKAGLVACNFFQQPDKGQQTLEQQYFNTIKQSLIKLHQQHCQVDQQTSKQVSFGMVRIANIPPCIALTEFLAETDWPDDTEIRVMAYHSQQVLLMRSIQEAHLDEVLKRDNSNAQNIFNNPLIRNHLSHCQRQNLIFILVTSPVEEVGRDHDFDWAVVEPSSMRSIIQLAGRVLRHRDKEPGKANLALMQYNLKALANHEDQPSYCRPGYETRDNRLSTHDLGELIDLDKMAQQVDAQPRIQRKKELNPRTNLADLEHDSIHQLLTRYENRGPEALQGWLTGCWWMTALPQLFNRFREGAEQQKVYVLPQDGEWSYVEKVYEKGQMKTPNTFYRIERHELSALSQSRLWLQRDYEKLLQEIAEYKGISFMQAALTYGELNLPTYGKDAMAIRFIHSSQLGLYPNREH